MGIYARSVFRAFIQGQGYLHGVNYFLLFSFWYFSHSFTETNGLIYLATGCVLINQDFFCVVRLCTGTKNGRFHNREGVVQLVAF